LAKLDLSSKTLAERISIDFSKVKLKKAVVKVPKIRIRKEKKYRETKNDNIPLSSIVSILIKAAIEKNKKEKKEKIIIEEGKSYSITKEESMHVQSGGYGTVSKSYSASPRSAYVDYGKLFGYLGKFKALGAYDNLENPFEFLNKTAESGSFVLADKESMDKIGRFDKYIRTPAMAIQTMALSLVPIAGLSSAEWEEIKMLMRFDPIMYTLKSKTS